MHRFRTALKWFLMIMLLPTLWFVGDLLFVSWGAETDHAAPADVIIVLGCNPIGENGPSTCMRARAGHAADLFQRGYAHNVIATGNPEEVSVLTYVLESDGVPADAITT